MSRQPTIVIPLYNEAGLLKNALPEFIAAWPAAEIIIVENGSRDGSRQLLAELAKKYQNLRVLNLPYPSFGAAVRTGLLAASRDQAILLNADWLEQHFIEASLANLDQADIVVGSKDLRQSHDSRPWFRKLTSHLLTAVVRLLYGYRGGDTHGLKAFNMQRVRPIIERCRSDEIIESELLVRAQKDHLKITEIPIELHELRPPRVSVARRIWRMGRELLILRLALKNKAVYPQLHADDGGYDRRSVEVLMDLAQAGRLAAISVLANAAELDYFVARFKKLSPDARPQLYLHFNLVEGRGLKIGQLTGKAQLIKQILKRRVDEDQVRQELTAQFDRLQKLGLPIVGLDSHQHMHALEPIAGVVSDFAKTRQLAIRHYGGFKATSWLGKLKLAVFKTAARFSNWRYRRRFRLPVTWQGSDKKFVVASWEKIGLAKSPAEIIVCHPAFGHDKSPTQ